MEKLFYGAAFYPELWDEKTIDQDIEMMKKTGINIVRIGEFWWSRLEPHEGKIDVSFVLDILEKLYKNDIKAILCTPTAAPPIWLTYNHNERLHVDSRGRLMIHGSRQHACTNNEYFRDRCKNIIEHIAEAVQNHPAVELWQLDNEFKCHISECFCKTCLKQWHEWLKKKYETIENLNSKWGTMVWSELYESFEQIPQPFENTPFLHNSSLSTMYRMFHREKIAEFAEEQAQVAITYSDRAEAFMLTESHSKDNYRNLMTDFYKNILDAGVHRDLIMEGGSLHEYKVLFTQFMYYLSNEYLNRAKEFVENGGIWIVGPLTGGRTENHTINLDAALGKELEDMAGVETLYTYPIENLGAFGEAFNIKAPLKLWSSVFELKGAEAVGIVRGGITDGIPFITENSYGRGKVVMLGSLPYEEQGNELIRALVNHCCNEAGVSLKYDVSRGTIVVPRQKDNELYEVVINMTGSDGWIDLKDNAADIFNESDVLKGRVSIRPYGYKILKRI